MYAEAFKYPFEGSDWVQPFVIGCVLVLAYGLIYLFASVLSLLLVGFLLYPLLLIPLVLLYGYVMTIFDGTIDGQPAAPQFRDWETIAIQGVRMFGLLFVYQLPIGILFGAYVVLAVGTSVGFDQAPSAAFAAQALGGLTLAVLLLSIVLWFAIAYVLPAALCAAAADHSIASGFHLDTLRACLSTEYAIGWVLAFATALFLGTFGLVLSVLLVGIPVVFYSIVVAGRLLAIGYREAIADTSADASEQPTRSVEGSTDGV